jgi:uncharacterized protein YggE
MRIIIPSVTVLLISVLLIQPAAPTAGAQEETQDAAETRTVSVSGSGQIEATPDMAIVRLGVQTEADEATSALTQNSEQMESLIQTLEDAGVPAEDIQTQTIRLQPQYEQTGPEASGPPELAGYVATNVAEVRLTDLAGEPDLGALLDAAVQAGGNRIEGIRFEVSDPSQPLDQARQAAWLDAEHKAEQLVELADAELGDVLTINESSRIPRPVVEQAVGGVAEAAVPIQPGTQSIEVDIQVTWLLR